METLPFRIMQSDGETVTCLANLADEVMARSVLSALVEDIFDQKGVSPTLWMEELVNGHWTVGSKIQIDEQRRFFKSIMQTGLDVDTVPDDRILWRRITANEKSIIVQALREFAQKRGDTLQLHARRTYLRMHEENSYGYSALEVQLRDFIFGPWEQLDHINNLAAYIERNPLIVESEIILPEQL